MRVALINEEAYPYAAGGIGPRCHQLLTGLSRHTFHLVTLSARRRSYAFGAPAEASDVPGRPALPGPSPRHRERRAAIAAAVELCRGLLGAGAPGRARFADGLRRLAELAGDGRDPLLNVPLGDVLLDAGRELRAAATDNPDVRLPRPRLSPAEARRAADLLRRAVRPLAYRLPPVDICHPVTAGAPLLVALAAKWRSGIPYLLSEDGSDPRERYSWHGERLPVAVRAVLLRFYRALSHLGYAEAGLVASVGRVKRRAEPRHVGHAAKVPGAPGAVDPARYPLPELEPAVPTVVWVGRIEPRAGLHTLIRAFQLVRDEVPHARLRLAGPVPEDADAYAQSCRALVDRLGLRDGVDFTGPVANSRQAYAAGHVVALPSIAERIPYRVIEAMMCGRPTVSSELGGVAEVVGEAGLVVPAGDATAFAAACTALLTDAERRRELAAAARRRALAHVTTGRMLPVYEQLYRDAQGHGPDGTTPTRRPADALVYAR